MKQSKTFRPLNIELVHWLDSSIDRGWRTKQEYLDGSKVTLECRTAGFVTYEDKTRLSLTLSESENSFNEQITIPKCAIIRRRRIMSASKLNRG